MFEIINNVFEEETFDSLVNQVTDFDNCPWFFVENSAFSEKTSNSLDYSWYHLAIANQLDNSPVSDACRNAAEELKSMIPKTHNTLERARFGMHTAQLENTLNRMHIDYLGVHTVALIYLNDSDGQTIIYDRKWDGTEKDSWPAGEFKELHRITPEKNKAIIFDGRYFHASSAPTKNPYRITLNLNFIER